MGELTSARNRKMRARNSWASARSRRLAERSMTNPYTRVSTTEVSIVDAMSRSDNRWCPGKRYPSGEVSETSATGPDSRAFKKIV